MIPEGYKKLDSWRTSKQLTSQYMLISLLALYFVTFIFLWIANFFLKKSVADIDLLLGTKLPFLLFVLFLVLNQLIVAVIHEAFHGFFTYIFGGKPRFGFMIIGKVFLGAYTTFDELLPRNKYIIVSIAPLFVLTILGLISIAIFPSIGPFLIYPLALNVGGSVVDSWLVKQALRYPSHVLIKNEKHELVVFGRETDESKKPK